MFWMYADRFGELPSLGQAAQQEALVAIAEQLERIANALSTTENPYILHGNELERAEKAIEVKQNE